MSPWPLYSPAASNSMSVGRGTEPAKKSFGCVRKKSWGVSFIIRRISGYRKCSIAPTMLSYSSCVYEKVRAYRLSPRSPMTTSATAFTTAASFSCGVRRRSEYWRSARAPVSMKVRTIPWIGGARSSICR